MNFSRFLIRKTIYFSHLTDFPVMAVMIYSPVNSMESDWDKPVNLTGPD